jgi:hypothetical protein
MADKISSKMYLVYDHRALSVSTNAAELLFGTPDQQEAIAQADEQHGVVYAYDLTAQEEYINETFVYDGTKA